MKILPKIFQQTSWQVLGKAVTSLSTFIILGLVARNYGEEGTGIFTLTLTYLAIFYLLSDFGFNAHVLRKIKNQKSKIKVEWQKLLGTRVVWSLVLLSLALGTLPLWPFTTADFAQAVSLGSLAIMGSGVFVTCNLIFQSKLRYDLSVLASSLGTVASLVILVYLVYLKLPVPFLLLAHFSGWMIIAIASLLLVKNFLQNVLPLYDKRYTINLFKDSWPIAATLSLNVIYFRADSFLIAYFKGISEVGIYNAAYSLFQTALVLPSFIMNSYYPLMLGSFTKVKLIGAGLLSVAFLGTILTIMLAPLLIQILTGGGFVGSTQSLQILSLGFPAYFLSSLLMWILVSKGRYKLLLSIYMLGLLINLSLNLTYIPQYSYIAASWITVVSEYLILLLQMMVLWVGRR